MDGAVCPGCHFECEIERYQCGRGEKLHARWVETGELPERRGPGFGPGPGGGRDQGGGRGGMPTIPVDDRVMHLLHIVGIALDDLADESGAGAPERRAIDCLMRHGGAASAWVVGERTHLDGLGPLLDGLQGDGLVAPRACGDTALYGLTERGAERARTWEGERKAAEAAFLGVLDDAEKEQLLALVMKLLEPGFKRRQGERNGQRA